MRIVLWGCARMSTFGTVWKSLLAKRRLRGTCRAPSTMLILTCSSKLQLLESALRKGLPETLSVCGAVMHINRGNPAQHEVVVDSWPEFKAVLTRPRKEVVKDKRDYYANLHAAFYRDEDACRILLENKDAIDWDKAFQLQGKAWALAISFPPLGNFRKCQKPGLQDGLYQAVKDMAEARRVHMEPHFFQAVLHPDAATFCLQDGLYQAVKVMAEARSVHMEPHFYQAVLHPDAATFCQNQLRSDPFHLGTLNPSHAALLNDTYEFGGNDRSLHYLRSLTEDFPNACLLGHKGQLVAWSLSDALGCLTHGYTLPEYRGKSHMKTVMQALARKLHAKDFALYTRVRAENKISKQLLSGQGFHLLPWTNFINSYPKICFLDKEDQPISWLLSNPLSCMTYGCYLPP
ncbi:Glycine N-acyltransferase-like protein 3, partial [Ophiophagus hannah]